MTPEEAARELEVSGVERPEEVVQGEVGRQLAEMRENFTPTAVRKSSKADSTFNKHQNNQERFILWLFRNRPEFVTDKLRRALAELDSNIDYSPVKKQFRRYCKNHGKKTLQQRKDEYRKDLLRDEISNFLGPPGTTPPRGVVQFEAVDANVDIFVEYLTACRKKNGRILKPGSYTAFCSSLTYLFFRYKYVPSRLFELDLKECMDGVKRYSNKALQHGEGNLYNGDRGLTWGLYEQFNLWFLAEGDDADGIFAAAVAKLTCNLACQGKSTSQVCTKHMKWEDDCFSIPFAHGKDQQLGNNSLKKLPRHCYANPLNFASDLPSSILHYFTLNPHVIANSKESVFPGNVELQATKFGRIVARICKKYEKIISDDFGFDIRDIRVHSWCKCAHTKLNTGSTCGPSGAAACIRGGHAMGGSKDIYIAQEKASDTFCGRILCGLPEHEAKFAVSYPDFVPIDAEQSLSGGVSESEYVERRKIVKIQVNEILDSIFGAENLAKFKGIRKLLRICLASHLQHRNAFEGPV